MSPPSPTSFCCSPMYVYTHTHWLSCEETLAQIRPLPLVQPCQSPIASRRAQGMGLKARDSLGVHLHFSSAHVFLPLPYYPLALGSDYIPHVRWPCCFLAELHLLAATVAVQGAPKYKGLQEAQQLWGFLWKLCYKPTISEFTSSTMIFAIQTKEFLQMFRSLSHTVGNSVALSLSLGLAPTRHLYLSLLIDLPIFVSP